MKLVTLRPKCNAVRSSISRLSVVQLNIVLLVWFRCTLTEKHLASSFDFVNKVNYLTIIETLERVVDPFEWNTLCIEKSVIKTAIFREFLL